MSAPRHPSTNPHRIRRGALWYRCCHWLCSRIYFDRIRVVWPERLPTNGPVLYIGLHRNGAGDGFVYHQLIPRGVFMVSSQLRRNWFGRIFFGGIEVARKKDEESGAGRNEAALRECVDWLAGGGELVIFPEGTSSLGPRHLPFKSGAASIAADALAAGVPLKIVPLGIHYECAWAFRSRVEVVVGEAISTELAGGLSGLGRLKELKRRMDRGLEKVGVNFASGADQEIGERLAYASTLGTGRSYFRSLKALEPLVPVSLIDRWNDFSKRGLMRHQGVPLFPGSPWIFYLLLLLVLGPLVLAGGLLNLPPILLGWLAARRFADERNVIALWRILVGVPAGVLWAVWIGCSVGAGWAIGYAVVTVVSLRVHRRVKKLVVAVWNGLMHRSIASDAWKFHEELLRELSRSS